MKSVSKDITEKLISLLNDDIKPCAMDDRMFCTTVTELIGDARLVLMGECTHGTAEFYHARSLLSQYLIEHHGFQAIAIEGDWTSAYPAHRYIQGHGTVNDPTAALENFKRFPAWMWRNTEMLKFLEKLREYNDQVSSKSEKVSFYGLDLYCLYESMQAVIDYLQEHHPEAAKKAVERYACFDHGQSDPQLYAYLTEQHLKSSCVKAVTSQLLETQHLLYQHIATNADENEQQFYATQNARVVKNAEHYYRALFEGQHVTWNIRDQHMADTLQNIITHQETLNGKPSKIIVWAHNSHVGDARATEMSERKEVNLGQLVRERFNTSSFLLGFSTAQGTVTAASKWGEKAHIKKIQPPLLGSYEWFFHQVKEKSFLLSLRQETPLNHLLKSAQLQRAIGVIYRPDTERLSHYYLSHLPYQFDAVLHFDETHALTPLDKTVLTMEES